MGAVSDDNQVRTKCSRFSNEYFIHLYSFYNHLLYSYDTLECLKWLETFIFMDDLPP